MDEATGDPPVFVDNDVLKTVVFVAYRTKREYKIGGTAFLLSHRIDGTMQYQIYFVTAAHVIESCKTHGADGKVWIRVNLKKNISEWIETSVSEWVLHEDGRVDVAVYPVNWTDSDYEERYDHAPLSGDLCLTETLVRSLSVSVGDELFFPGLFTKNVGNERNEPILRSGILAAIPSGPVSTKRGVTKVYLAEVKSIGGHSGSPVILHFGAEHQLVFKSRSYVIPAEVSAISKHQPDILHNPILGLIHGHFDVKPDEHTGYLPVASPDFDKCVTDVNSGIAAVTPAYRILEVFQDPVLVAQRAKKREFIENVDNGAVMD